MKKFAIIISIILALFCIRYCTCNACYGIHLTSSRFAKYKGEQIMEDIRQEDIDSLKKMFCKQISSTHDLDSELNELINFIDGEISSDFSVSEGSCWEQVRSGKITFSSIAIDVTSISTDSCKYRACISYNATCEENDKIGIKRITIFNITQTNDISKLNEDDIYQVGADI